MPIYEYGCAKCGRVSGFLVRNMAAHTTPACPHCGSRRMSRAVSRVAIVGAAKAAAPGAGAPGAPPTGGGDGPMPDLAGMESVLGGVDENDPRSIGRAMRKLAQTSGEPMDGEMEEVVRRLESGEDPEKIEEKMGESPGKTGSGGGDDLYDG